MRHALPGRPSIALENVREHLLNPSLISSEHTSNPRFPMHRRARLPLCWLTAISLSVCGVLKSEEEPAELVQARGAYEKEIEFSARPIRDRYLSRLNTLKRTLGARGDARGAAVVQDEIDRVTASIPDPGMARFVGAWKITYPSGETKRYVISQEGSVTFDESMGKKIPPQKAKLVQKGSDVLLDFKNGAIERLKVTARGLSVEHFNPKERYPDGAPLTVAIGTPAAGR